MANLFKDSEKEQMLNSDIDNDISEYIQCYNNSTYDKVLKSDDRWEVFYHLSSMREAVLNWYDFGTNTNLLEIGGGFGALTGLFSRKCAHVVTLEPVPLRAEAMAIRYSERKNLDIYEKSLTEFVTQEKFDFVVAVGILETQNNGRENKAIYSDFLQCASKFLKPEGKLIFAVENRYGIRYFCGAPEPYSGIPFEGINRFPKGLGKGYLFDRQEICDILKLAGINNYKFYYPFPDYKIPQMVYSDNYLKGINIRERLIPYYLNKDTLIASEMDLYLDLINNNVLPFFANSFLVECFNNSYPCDVNYATVSEDRGAECGFITAVCDGNIVKKRALYREGIKNLEKSYQNILDLKEKGIKVIDHNLTGNILEMPYEESITCSNYLLNIITEAPDEFISVLDKLYEHILNSSEKNMDQCFLDDVYGKMDWGPVLKKAYIDMVPVNCFYKNDNLFFFDQEFTMDDCPAKFVMFRAIKYTYIYIKLAEKYVSMQTLKKHFEISDRLWDVFEEVEKRFILSNRNKDLYKNYYRWTGVSRNKIAKNAELLLNGVQKITNNSPNTEVIPGEIQQVQKILIDLLHKFVQVCNKLGLQYFLFFGSLLGAVRNGGIIPWDDDVDVLMPRKDYNKLLAVAQHEFENPYFLQQPLNDSRCFYGGFSKLRNCNTSGFESPLGHAKGNQGIAIDILPLDDIEADNIVRKKRIDKIKNIQEILFVQSYGVGAKRLKDLTEKEIKRCKFWADLVPRKILCKKLDILLEGKHNESTELCCVLARYVEEKQKRVLFKESFADFKEVEFSGMKLRIPIGYDQCLKTLYGKNYMELPPAEKRVPSHKYRYFVDIPFSKFWTEDFFVEGKKIVLYGHGGPIDYFLKNHSFKYWPEFIVDDDEGMWGRNKEGIIIYSPEKLGEISSDKYQLIICDDNLRRRVPKVKGMKFDNFYFMRRW